MLDLLLVVSYYINLVALYTVVVDTLTGTATGDKKLVPVESKNLKKGNIYCKVLYLSSC